MQTSLRSGSRHDLRRAIKKEPPAPQNAIFTNHLYRDKQAGDKYAKAAGYHELVTSKTPLRYYVQGVVSGKIKEHKILSGFLETVMITEDKAARGVGMQGMRWPIEYDNLLHIIFIENPASYRLLTKYIPGRTERSFRAIDRKRPQMPFEICQRTFTHVREHLDILDYHGPVGICWDDSKLFPTWRLDWDPDQDCSVLLGCVDGPVCVPDTDAARVIMEDSNFVLAEKVRLFCAQVPLPGIAPVLVAAIPVKDTLNVVELEVYSSLIIRGLLDVNVHVVSAACDGTETERGIQRLLTKTADSAITYSLPSPNDHHVYNVSVEIPVIKRHPVVMIQDSLHFRKTARNGHFSGGRCQKIGNFPILYRHIYLASMLADSPLYHRDVVKVDKQDDNAAARLFSADSIRHLIHHFPQFLGDIVYLFIFGELVDAYQNRHISHLERLKIALRALYFIGMWRAYLRKIGDPERLYFLSREAADIANILVHGLYGLVVIYRDYYSVTSPLPLLPWLHSSEGAEHTFGEARKVNADFTLQNFVNMIGKLTTKIREAVVLSQSTASPMACADGYNHIVYGLYKHRRPHTLVVPYRHGHPRDLCHCVPGGRSADCLARH